VSVAPPLSLSAEFVRDPPKSSRLVVPVHVAVAVKVHVNVEVNDNALALSLPS
jgi:hypothetical protein